jgi:hypothetical protein
MAPTQTMHHHRSTTKTSHKPFKGRHASKGALKEQNKGTAKLNLQMHIQTSQIHY